MEIQDSDNVSSALNYAQNTTSEIYISQDIFSKEDMLTVFDTLNKFNNFFQQHCVTNVDGILVKKVIPESKTSFLVFKHQRYITIPTQSIAFFHVKNECSIITCFNGTEYIVNYSLDQIQNLLKEKDFFRLNRQYLISFCAIKEVEHYFKRKLYVKLAIPIEDKLIVSKEKASCFLNWLEER